MLLFPLIIRGAAEPADNKEGLVMEFNSFNLEQEMKRKQLETEKIAANHWINTTAAIGESLSTGRKRDFIQRLAARFRKVREPYHLKE
jgi:hypothetical protein